MEFFFCRRSNSAVVQLAERWTAESCCSAVEYLLLCTGSDASGVRCYLPNIITSRSSPPFSLAFFESPLRPFFTSSNANDFFCKWLFRAHMRPGAPTALKTSPCWRSSNKPGVSNPAASLHLGPSQTSDPKRQNSCLKPGSGPPVSWAGGHAISQQRKKTPHAHPIDSTRRQPTAVAVICTPPWQAVPLA